MGHIYLILGPKNLVALFFELGQRIFSDLFLLYILQYHLLQMSTQINAFTFVGVFDPECFIYLLKGCVCYIFASLFCMSKRGHFRNKEKYFLFQFESSFHS